MKRFLLLLFFVPSLLMAQEKNYDTVALMILDRMSDVIGDLSSCSFVLHTATDKMDTGVVVTSYAKNSVSMVGPNKMQVRVWDNKGHKEYFYNDSVLHFYYFDENNYATVEAPENIVTTMDTIHDRYGIDFPAADFFYPTFTDDLLAYADDISFIGTETLDGESCFHILAKGKDMNIQVWVANDATTLPKKLLINYTANSKNVQRYEASFSGWKMNPDLPDAMFDFMPPPNANFIYLMPLNAEEN